MRRVSVELLIILLVNKSPNKILKRSKLQPIKDISWDEKINNKNAKTGMKKRKAFGIFIFLITFTLLFIEI
jgi:hypothetical protein